MIKRILSIALFASFAATVHAEAQGISNLYTAGVSYSAGATPSVAGTALYAHQVSGSGTYAFTMIDLLPATVKPFTVTTNIGIGVAQKIATIAGVPIFVPTSVGFSEAGTNMGWQYSTGAGAPFQIKKTNWYVMPTIRVLKSSVGGSGYQPIFGVLFGWGQ